MKEHLLDQVPYRFCEEVVGQYMAHIPGRGFEPTGGTGKFRGGIFITEFGDRYVFSDGEHFFSVPESTTCIQLSWAGCKNGVKDLPVLLDHVFKMHPKLDSVCR